MKKNRYGLILAALATLQLTASAATVLLNDQFADNERLTQNLPTSADWAYRGGLDNNSLAAGSGVMTYTSEARNINIYSYFTDGAGSAYTIQDGETLTLSFDITLSALANSADGIRLGLFNSYDSRVTSDGSTWLYSQVENWTGYSLWLNAGASGNYNIKDRIGTSTALFASSSSVNATLGDSGTADVGLTVDTLAPVSLSLSRNGTELTIIGNVNGTSIGRTDTTVDSFSFDSFALQLGSSALALSETAIIDNFQIEITVSTPSSATALLDDQFADNERATQNLPSSADWAYRGGLINSSLAAGSGVMTYTSEARTINILSYFTDGTGSALTLQDGEKLTLSFDVSMSSPLSSADGIRFGLFNSYDSRVTSDGSSWMLSQFNDWDGYSLWFNAGGSGNYNIKDRTGTSTAIFTSSGNTLLGSNGSTDVGLTANTAAAVSFALTRNGSELQIDASVNGAPISRTDTAVDSFSFDSFAFQLASSALAAGETIVFDNVLVDITAAPVVPETATAAILSITSFSSSVMELVVSSDNPSLCYPKSASTLTTNTLWSSVGHSTNGMAPFVVTNLNYSSAAESNFVIYVEADQDQKFFDIRDQ